MDTEKTSTAISELGEFALIKHLTKNVVIHNQSTIKGIGDDAAVLQYNDKHTVITTDLLIEGVHFNLMYTPLKHLGYKSVVVNLSDVCAMNAIPRQITVSIAVSNRFPVEALNELYAGILLACETYKIDLIGGDTSSSLKGLVISITAIGEADKTDLVYRDGATKNDLLFVSGDLGGAYMGLQLLEREKEIFKTNPYIQPELSAYNYILERQLKPEARADIVRLFRNLNIKPTSMIDIPDGLSSEVLHICTNSKVGCRIFEEKIPINEQTALMAEEFQMTPVVAALSGGEDYELLFTVPVAMYDKVKEPFIMAHVHLIGHITDKKEGTILQTSDGNEIPIIAQGWDGMKEHENK